MSSKKRTRTGICANPGQYEEYLIFVENESPKLTPKLRRKALSRHVLRRIVECGKPEIALEKMQSASLRKRTQHARLLRLLNKEPTRRVGSEGLA